MLVITKDYWYQHGVKKNKIWLEKEDHSEISQHFSATNIFVAEMSTTQYSTSAGSQEAGMDYEEV